MEAERYLEEAERYSAHNYHPLPVVLTRGRWQVRHPATALSLWFGAFFTGTGLALAAVIIAAVVSTTAAPSPPPQDARLIVRSKQGGPNRRSQRK